MLRRCTVSRYAAAATAKSTGRLTTSMFGPGRLPTARLPLALVVPPVRAVTSWRSCSNMSSGPSSSGGTSRFKPTVTQGEENAAPPPPPQSAAGQPAAEKPAAPRADPVAGQAVEEQPTQAAEKAPVDSSSSAATTVSGSSTTAAATDDAKKSGGEEAHQGKEKDDDGEPRKWYQKLHLWKLLKEHGVAFALYYFVLNESTCIGIAVALHYNYVGTGDVMDVLRYFNVDKVGSLDFGNVEKLHTHFGPVSLSGKFLLNYTAATYLTSCITWIQIPFCVVTLPYVRAAVRRMTGGVFRSKAAASPATTATSATPTATTAASQATTAAGAAAASSASSAASGEAPVGDESATKRAADGGQASATPPSSSS